MGIPASIGIGAAGGAVAGMALHVATSDVSIPAAIPLGMVTAVPGALTGLAAGLLARRGMGSAKAALAGAAMVGVLPAALLVGSRFVPADNGSWADLAMAAAGIMTGAGVAGGGAALVAKALLRR